MSNRNQPDQRHDEKKNRRPFPHGLSPRPKVAVAIVKPEEEDGGHATNRQSDDGQGAHPATGRVEFWRALS